MNKFKLQLIEGWENFWKMYSIQGIAFMSVLPDIWNLVVASGLMDSEETPKSFSYLLKLIALVVAIMRLLKQKSLELTPQDASVKVQEDVEPLR